MVGTIAKARLGASGNRLFESPYPRKSGPCIRPSLCTPRVNGKVKKQDCFFFAQTFTKLVTPERSIYLLVGGAKKQSFCCLRNSLATIACSLEEVLLCHFAKVIQYRAHMIGTSLGVTPHQDRPSLEFSAFHCSRSFLVWLKKLSTCQPTYLQLPCGSKDLFNQYPTAFQLKEKEDIDELNIAQTESVFNRGLPGYRQSPNFFGIISLQDSGRFP